MYIGPWQEFKLAKILQLKEKVEREDNDANTLADNASGNQQKAFSVGTHQFNRRMENGASPAGLTDS
jgi:hypothetical protein